MRSIAIKTASFRIEDVDEARIVGSQFFFDHRLEAGPDWQRFLMDGGVGQVGTVSAGTVRYHSSVTAQMDGEEDTYGALVPHEGSGFATSGDDHALVSASSAYVLRPGAPVTTMWWGGSAAPISLLRFDRFAVEAVLRGVLGRDVEGPIMIESALDLTTPRGQQWWELARQVTIACQVPDGLVMNPLLSAPLESTLAIGLLLATRHQYRDDMDGLGRDAAPELVRRALVIIDERPDQPLTMAGIAAEVGCSLRTLEMGFRKHVGMTPRERLAQVRLDRVHRDLVVGTPETTSVSDVALRWGIGHFGRFSRDYRRVYGVLPSVTLRSD